MAPHFLATWRIPENCAILCRVPFVAYHEKALMKLKSGVGFRGLARHSILLQTHQSPTTMFKEPMATMLWFSVQCVLDGNTSVPIKTQP